MRFFIFILLIFTPLLMIAQERPFKRAFSDSTSINEDSQNPKFSDRTNTFSTKSKDDNPSIEKYILYSQERDSLIVDTSLTIKKEYKFNYLRKDNFNLMAFGNLGQTYNTLSYDIDIPHLQPVFGARARHFNYMEIDDIYYYSVPTPFTEIMYKTGFTQGQVLDALFSTNVSKQFNFSLAYKGMRSLGKYQHTLTSTGNFRFTSNYFSKDLRYKMVSHIVMQDLMNEENGGLTPEGVENFISGNEEFRDRSVFTPQFEDAESMLRGRRYFLNHSYSLSNPKDSLNHKIEVGNKIMFEDKYYHYQQNSSKNQIFGDAYSSKIDDKVTHEDFDVSLYANYGHSELGDLKISLNYNDYNYGYNSVLIRNDSYIPNRLKGDLVSATGSYSNGFGKTSIKFDYGANIIGDLEGHYISAAIDNKQDKFSSFFKFNLNSSIPKLNQLLYQSDYVAYNWNNSETFNNIETTSFELGLAINSLFTLSGDYRLINNYTFFSKSNEGMGVVPFQDEGQIAYYRIKLSNEFHFGKFSLDNTVMYQQSNSNSLNVPEIITRNTLYYSNHFFEKKALFLQTGVIFNFFTKYNMDDYDPVLAEFYVQNDTAIGGFPRLDFFINAKVRQTRIFLKAEHFNSSFTGYNYFSAPAYPYRDFTVRFGLVWNFFL